MLNEERVKLMTKLAIYEKKNGKRDIPMSRYYKSDYVSYHMIRSWMIATLGFILCIVVWFLLNMSFFMEENNIVKIDVMTSIGKNILMTYVIYIAAYLAVTYVVYNARFLKVRDRLKEYNGNLKKLSKIYQEEDRLKEEIESGGLERNDDIFSI